MDSKQQVRFERLTDGKAIPAECPGQVLEFESDIGWEMRFLLQYRVSSVLGPPSTETGRFAVDTE
jgi:hypothetical protein